MMKIGLLFGICKCTYTSPVDCYLINSYAPYKPELVSLMGIFSDIDGYNWIPFDIFHICVSHHLYMHQVTNIGNVPSPWLVFYIITEKSFLKLTDILCIVWSTFKNIISGIKFNDGQYHKKLEQSYSFDKNKDQKTNFCQKKLYIWLTHARSQKWFLAYVSWIYSFIDKNLAFDICFCQNCNYVQASCDSHLLENL